MENVSYFFNESVFSSDMNSKEDIDHAIIETFEGIGLKSQKKDGRALKENKKLKEYFSVSEEEADTAPMENETETETEKTFDVIKETVVKGRRRKSNDILQEIDGKHTKYKKDNIRRKIKVNLTHCVILFLNALIKIKWNGHQKNKFRTLDNEITKNITIKFNAKLHLMTIKDFICQKVSNKFKCEKVQNEKTAKILSKLQPDFFHPIFHMTVKDFFENIFCGKPYEVIKEYNLKKDNICIKEKKFPKFFSDNCCNFDDDYRKLYSEEVGNFFYYFQKTTPRNRSKKATKKNKNYFKTLF